MQTNKNFSHPISTFSLRLWSEIATLGMIAMELTWIAAWYVLTTQPRSNLATTILILGVALSGSYGIGRAMNALHWRLSIRRAVFLVWLVVYALLSLKALLFPQIGSGLAGLFPYPMSAISDSQWVVREFWHVMVICLLGLRGAALATMVVEQHRVLASMQLGLLLFLLYGLGKSISDPVGTSLFFFIFLVFSLLSLSAANIAGISDLRGGRLPRLNWAWTTGILASACMAAAIAVLAGLLLSARVVSAFLGQILLGLITGFIALIALLLTPLILLIYWILTYLAKILSGLVDRKVFDTLLQNLNLMNLSNQDQMGKVINTTDLRNIILGIAIAAIILVTLFILRRQPRQRRLVGEEDNLISGAIRPALDPSKARKNRFRLFNPRRLLAAAQVRRIYAQLMDLCEKLGHPRPTALTPLEFLPTLRQVFPDGEEQVSLISNAYLKVRYGELPETVNQVEEVRQAWKCLANRRARSRTLSKKITPR